MAEYKFVGPVNRHVESSEAILLPGDRVLSLGGDAVELSDAEVKHLEDRFALERVVEAQPLTAVKKPELHVVASHDATEKEVK